MGKFESIHLGHRALVGNMIKLAKPDLATALVVFEPHPYRVLFDPGYKPLFTRCEREHLVRGLGVDYLLEYPFSQDLAALPPEDFCRKIYEELQAKIVVVGEDYHFGHKRMGTANTLRQAATRYNAQVHVMAHHGANGAAYNGVAKTSTSSIRALLSANKLHEANDLLGIPFFIMGDVIPGRQLGRTIGIPTINLHPPAEKFLPPDGVYATRTIIGNRCYKGVTNIGIRPTVESANAPRLVETHLLGFDGGDLYGSHVRKEFIYFIRPERRFDSLDLLRAQILEDCRTASRHANLLGF